VQDGGSTDDTVGILEGTRGVDWVSGPDGGQSEAVNTGVARSHGQVLGWLNSDDIYYPEAVSSAMEEFLLKPDAGVVYGEANYIGVDGLPLSRYPTQDYDWERWADTCFICQPAAFIRREAWEAVNGLDTSLTCSMDYDLWLRLAAAGVRFSRHGARGAGSRMYLDNKSLALRRRVHEESLDIVRRHMGRLSRGWLVGLAEFCLHDSDGYFVKPDVTPGVEFLADIFTLALRNGCIDDLWEIGARFRAEGIA
jgi:glycosyltransferase involved in cell wall biosynthesis